MYQDVMQSGRFEIKQYGKRLETIDGVEIASSYKEYLDLALGDLEDRLRKSYAKLSDFKERITKRTNLLSEIINESDRRHDYAQKLSEKDKLLRTRLIRNTEMKNALQNLADIAGYKLNSLEKSQVYSTSISNDNLMNFSRIDENLSTLNNSKEQEARNLTSILADKFGEKANNTTYTRYIEMAYAEVDSLLVNDKQTLVEVIRKLKTNDYKLKELEQLKIKVNASLNRLHEFESQMSDEINHDSQIANTVRQLEGQIKLNILSHKENKNQ